ncbi:MAG: aminoacyl-tRNA hydrolase [Planctomycetota bacterium]
MEARRTVRRLVCGLGNPGPDYADTRHNVGYRVLDHLALHEGLLFLSPATLDGYGGPRSFTCARAFDPDALLVKPATFMNRSGDVVAPLVRWAGVEPGDLLVVYDDLDLPLAHLRLRPAGGAGGHNGMRSIIQSLGTDRFPRLRVGIGRGPTAAARHVLSRFRPDEEVEIQISIAEAAEAVLLFLRTGDIEACMTRFHSRWNQGSGE